MQENISIQKYDTSTNIPNSRTKEKQKVKWYRVDLSLIWPIAGSNIYRIGFLRTIVGGGSMYFSIPLFILFHLTGIIWFFQWILSPLLGLKKLKQKNYIILDRHKIDGLPWFDKFNCVFCGYANGMCHLLNAKTDQIDEKSKVEKEKISYVKSFFVILALIPFIPLALVIQFLGVEFLFNILISRPLGMHRLSMKEASQLFDEKTYAKNLNSVARFLVLYEKKFALQLTNALEQIETMWCPLNHLDIREEAQYPKHHALFFKPNQIEEMKQVLKTKGSVSPKQPKW